MNDIRQQLATARAFARTAQQAPLLLKARAIEQMVEAMLYAMEAIADDIERLERRGGNV